MIIAAHDDIVARIPVEAPPEHIIGEIRYSVNCPGSGWFECDGTNGTIDMRETRLYGVNSSGTVGTLANDQMKSHTHSFSVSGAYESTSVKLSGGTTTASAAVTGQQVLNNKTSGAVEFPADYPVTVEGYSRSKTYYVKIWVYLGE